MKKNDTLKDRISAMLDGVPLVECLGIIKAMEIELEYQSFQAIIADTMKGIDQKKILFKVSKMKDKAVG